MAVGRTHHHVVFPYRWGGIYFAARLEGPRFTAGLRVERINLPVGIGCYHELLVGSQSGTDIAIVLERPYLAHGGMPRIHVVAGPVIVAAFRFEMVVYQGNGRPCGLRTHAWVALLVGGLTISDGNDIVATHGVFGPQVRTTHDTGDTLEIVFTVQVAVAAEKELHIAHLYTVERFEPVVERRVLRVMVYIDERHIHIGICREEGVHPHQVFAGHLAWAHAHVGARVRTHEEVPFVHEGERFAAENLAEAVAPAFGPIGVVVA